MSSLHPDSSVVGHETMPHSITFRRDVAAAAASLPKSRSKLSSLLTNVRNAMRSFKKKGRKQRKQTQQQEEPLKDPDALLVKAQIVDEKDDDSLDSAPLLLHQTGGKDEEHVQILKEEEDNESAVHIFEDDDISVLTAQVTRVENIREEEQVEEQQVEEYLQDAAMAKVKRFARDSELQWDVRQRQARRQQQQQRPQEAYVSRVYDEGENNNNNNNEANAARWSWPVPAEISTAAHHHQEDKPQVDWLNLLDNLEPLPEDESKRVKIQKKKQQQEQQQHRRALSATSVVVGGMLALAAINSPTSFSDDMSLSSFGSDFSFGSFGGGGSLHNNGLPPSCDFLRSQAPTVTRKESSLLPGLYF